MDPSVIRKGATQCRLHGAAQVGVELRQERVIKPATITTELLGDLRDIKAPASENKLGGRGIK